MSRCPGSARTLLVLTCLQWGSSRAAGMWQHSWGPGPPLLQCPPTCSSEPAHARAPWHGLLPSPGPGRVMASSWGLPRPQPSAFLVATAPETEGVRSLSSWSSVWTNSQGANGSVGWGKAPAHPHPAGSSLGLSSRSRGLLLTPVGLSCARGIQRDTAAMVGSPLPLPAPACISFPRPQCCEQVEPADLLVGQGPSEQGNLRHSG